MPSETVFPAPNRAITGRDLDLRAMGRVLRRRRAWVLWPTLACFALALLFVTLVHPRYTGEAKVIVENGETYFTRPEKTDQLPAQLPDDEAVQSQVQLIMSRDIARQAITRLGLKGNPEFDPLAGGLNPLSSLLVKLGLIRDPNTIPPEDRILETYYERLAAFPVLKSRVISIEFTSTDPDLAARGANTIAELYRDAQSSAKRDAARSAAASLSSLLGDLQKRASEAESEADAFRSQSGLLLGTNNNTITGQQLADINTQLAQARTAQADAQAKAKLLREMLRQGRVAEVPDIANNELIRRVSEQRVTLRAEMALQSRSLLPGHPHMQELTAQLADVDSQLRAAAEKAMRTLENDARIASDRVGNLETAMTVQKRAASTAGADQVQLNALELKSRLLKEQLEFNTAKYQEAVARENAASTPSDARVISRAVVPQQPSFPKKLPILALATLAGLLMSGGALISRELLSGRAYTVDDLDEMVPQPVGSYVERDRRVRRAVDLQPAAARSDPEDAALTEVLHALRARERGQRATRALVTAPVANRDTPRAALALARLLASEARTILVDFNAEMPAVETAALAVIAADDASRDPPGIAELLDGSASFAEVIHRDRSTRLHVVPLGRDALPADLAADIGPVLNALSETYDYVVLHAPAPSHAVTRVLAGESDISVLTTAGLDPEAAGDADRQALLDAGTGQVYRVSTARLAASEPVRDAA